MEENNIMLSIEENIPVVVEAVTEFNKSYSTQTYYKELIKNGYSINDAVKKVCNKFDCYCSQTSNVNYLMERYTKLYNHNKITNPLAFSLVAVMLSLTINIGFDIYDGVIPSNNITIEIILINVVKYILITLVTLWGIKEIFKTLEHTYSPYDVFILPYERERIYKELVNRGYTVPEIKE